MLKKSRQVCLKVGLDIHGVIDTYPERFRLLSNALVKDGAEVHVITGVKKSPRIVALLEQAGIAYSHYFSIVEHLEGSGEKLEWRADQPFADEEKWNRAKRDYCLAQKIDFMFDDSEIYRETFYDIETTFLHVINSRA